jgi:hypothetical protein
MMALSLSFLMSYSRLVVTVNGLDLGILNEDQEVLE